jgi:hypothetical protein
MLCCAVLLGGEEGGSFPCACCGQAKPSDTVPEYVIPSHLKITESPQGDYFCTTECKLIYLTLGDGLSN